MSKVLIFGYGSLIHEKSRNQTAKCGRAWAVDVQGFERSWDIRCEKRQMTCVGLHEAFEKTVNGVIFEIDEADLEKFDQREALYERVEIDSKFMYSYNRKAIPADVKAYTYVTKNAQTPDNDFPICYSYLEICLLGCLRHDRLMAQQFVHWTTKWLKPFFEDDSADGFLPTERQEDAIEELLERMPVEEDGDTESEADKEKPKSKPRPKGRAKKTASEKAR
ncbi:MAG: gamma-glutamylcyclotransferase [Planctomycetes bacterium]|nr:gamma-glutamylcyclotransferase [Planctomycetota bacterium]